MKLIHNKDYDTLSLKIEDELEKSGFSVTPGSIAKLFANIITKYISEFYDDLTSIHLLSFLSTTSGEYVDLIGSLLNVERGINESDESYKYRISTTVESMSRANELAVRLAVLRVDGVEDVILKKYSHGPGSFTVIPLSSSYNNNLENAVYEKIHEVCSVGERVIVKNADFKEVKIDVNLVLTQGVDDRTRQTISVNVATAIDDYINNHIRIGEPLIINQLTNRILGASNDIINYTFNSFKINNKDCLIINQSSKWDEKFIVSSDIDSIVIR